MGMAQWFRRCAIASRQKYRVRNKRFHSFNTATTVGLVFKLEKDVLPAEVIAMMKFLQRKHISCSLLGYYDGDALPASIINTSMVSVFTRKELSWYGRPVADDVKRFLHKGYDIVIDFCRQPDVYPIQYIVSTVHASMIIGGVQYARCPYDLIVDAQQVCTPEQYVQQIRHYLSVINNPHHVKHRTKSVAYE